MTRAASKSASQKLSPGQGLLFVLLAALLGAASWNFYLLNERARQEAEYLALTTAIQVRAQQLARTASEAAQGDVDALSDLAGLRSDISQAVNSLREGNPALALPPSPDNVNASLATLEDIWRRIDRDSGQLIERTDLLLTLADAAADFSAAVPRLQATTDQVVQRLVATRAEPAQIYVASRQLALADRMLREVGNIIDGGSGAMTAADGFSRDATLFGRVLRGLLDGAEELGVEQVTDSEARQTLESVSSLFADVGDDVETILTASTDLFEVRQAADEIGFDAEELTAQAAVLADDYRNLDEARLWPSLTAGIVLAAATLLVLFSLGLGAYRNQRRNARMTAEINQRNQEAILRLLDEMSSLADGDLTVEATVTEDVTGAIADSVNYAVEALRDLVAGVNSTARQVAAQAQETRATTIQLAESSEHQAREIGTATDNINEMARSFDDMAGRSNESAEVAQSSVETANRGADMVRQTIAGMDNIRNQIQETSKRIKRLGESSQEIGDIVELISGLSEQTNVLALNAAIQAASAGGAGRGFAVVADEVQRLAERATDATRRIEALVQTIQSDTSEAVNSMEETTSQVVSGARLAEDAGEALESIERVSNDLAGLIQNISHQAQEESRSATRIAAMMNGIRDISVQTSEGTGQTATSVASLAELVRELRESVADFKLPEDDDA
ncbi:methyl-accepting chemotaxis protein [Wenzhouxiangella limi]|uniref:Methyl-accepting chemotaxis protein n=1 Tax=Wenzhouxiangella limi TaxID=2707351 RepID=A0A845UYZ2_9GAMM|nr:methyl-accepting chemotaxis protein [Wenzhouxiangella limi]NDY95938.1 methyl-accepting chemotaxis protein [Wenzhouxiangella limi]